MTRGEHPSAFAIDAFAVDALTGEEAVQTRAHVETCALCKSRVDEGDQQRKRFAMRIDRSLATATQRHRSWQRWFAFKLAAPAMAAAALVVMLLHLRTAPVAHVQADDDLGIKGGPVFEVYALHDHKVSGVTEGAVLAPGDEIRFAVIPQGKAYILVASVDGTGQVTIYYPYNAERSASVQPRRRTELPGSIVLDEAPGPERLVALFSNEPILAADVKAKLHELGARGAHARPLAIDAAQVSVTFEKAR